MTISKYLSKPIIMLDNAFLQIKENTFYVYTGIIIDKHDDCGENGENIIIIFLIANVILMKVRNKLMQ